MDFHLDRKLHVKTQPEFKNLYSWAINEVDGEGRLIGRDQIPWCWSLYFVATEVVLADTVNIKGRAEGGRLSSHDEPSSRRIQAALAPLYRGRGDEWFEKTKYRMFGTDRTINDIRLDIRRLNEEDDPETCQTWGCVSYTTEHDFRDVTSDDCLVFYLMVKPSTFDRFAARVIAGTLDEVCLTVGSVAGFYSDWSPSISTTEIKVLTRGREHDIQIPEDSGIEPPRLGYVGEAQLSMSSKRVQARNLTTSADAEGADIGHEPLPLTEPQTAASPSAIDPKVLKLLHSLNESGRWVVGLLIVLVIATLWRT